MSNNLRIGIITFHDADNVGAVLQTYALQSFLVNNYPDLVEIIDYKCAKIQATKKFEAKKKSIKNFIKNIAYSVYYKIKNIGFNKFRKRYLNISENSFDKNTIKECVNNYDIFITGSDQVWNLGCTDYDYTYFLDFVPTTKKKYSYAASLGVYQFNEEERRKVVPYLNEFQNISVRERSVISVLDLSKEIQVHLDPVFLLSKEQWRNLVSKRLNKKKYVFVYLIQEDVNVLNKATIYAQEKGFEIINNKKTLKFILHNSPSEFLSWLFYAEAVFTNSFHGTAFGLIFNKKLRADIALKNGGINNRVKELLESAGAQKCIIDDSQSSKIKEINVDDWIFEEREKSMNYLNEIGIDKRAKK